MEKKKNGAIFVILAAILWGTLPVFIRYFNNFASIEISFLRCTFSTLLLGIYCLIFKKDSFKIKLKDLWCFIGTGIISLLFFNICYCESIKHTSLSIAAILLYTAPGFVMIMSAILFKEKITKVKLISLMIAFLGCVFVSGVFSGENTLGLKGLIIGLGSGIGYALYSIFGRYALNRGYSSCTVSLYTFMFAAIGSIPFLGSDFFRNLTASYTTIPVAIAFAFFTAVLAYVLYTTGLERLEASKASIIACIEPVTATFLGFVIYKEVPDIYSIIGLVLVLGSTIIVNIKEK